VARTSSFWTSDSERKDWICWRSKVGAFPASNSWKNGEKGMSHVFLVDEYIYREREIDR